MRVESASAAHVRSEELAGYLDDRLDAKSCARLESHLADCADCRADLVGVRELLASSHAPTAPASFARAPRARTWLIAASILTMAVLPVLHRLVQTGEQSPIRASRPAAASVEVIAPPATAVDVVSVLFAWRPVEGASTYRLTVTDSSGALVLTKVTSDTTIVAPPSASFHRGSSYLWYVDCLTTTGRTVSSGIRSFSTSR